MAVEETINNDHLAEAAEVAVKETLNDDLLAEAEEAARKAVPLTTIAKYPKDREEYSDQSSDDGGKNDEPTWTSEVQRLQRGTCLPAGLLLET